MKLDNTVTAERLREQLDYDPDTGDFRWKVRRRGVRCGSVAGHLRSDGYRMIRLDGELYEAHRLAWVYVYGSWPAGEVDHKNQNPSDNRLSNLRDATHAENSHNVSKARTRNSTGFLGVARVGNRWTARIMADGHYRYLGCFKTPEDASAAYLAAKRELHPFWPGR